MDDDDPFDEDPTRSSADGTSGHTREVRTCKATDSDILPTLVWYRSGEYVQSLPALERELPQGGIVRGEQGCKDLQNLLRRWAPFRLSPFLSVQPLPSSIISYQAITDLLLVRNGIITDPESGPL
jgi:hypothetical protein